MATKRFQTLFLRGDLKGFIKSFVKNFEVIDIRVYYRYKDEAKIQIGIHPAGITKPNMDAGYSFAETKKDPPYIEISLKTGYISFYNGFFISSESILAGFIAFLLTSDGINRLKESAALTIERNPNEIILPLPKPIEIKI